MPLSLKRDRERAREWRKDERYHVRQSAKRTAQREKARRAWHHECSTVDDSAGDEVCPQPPSTSARL
jgi:hypothetical protein